MLDNKLGPIKHAMGYGMSAKKLAHLFPKEIEVLKKSVLETYSERQTRTDPNYDVIRGRLQDPRVANWVLTALRSLVEVSTLLTDVKAHIIYGKAMPSEYVDMDNPVPPDVQAKLQDPLIAPLLHAVLGLGSESGELAESMELFLLNMEAGSLDKTNVAVEFGDISWFLRAGLAAIDVSLFTCLEQNHAKLLKRFPEKFTEDAAINRDKDAERIVEESFVTNQADGTGDPDGKS